MTNNSLDFNWEKRHRLVDALQTARNMPKGHGRLKALGIGTASSVVATAAGIAAMSIFTGGAAFVAWGVVAASTSLAGVQLASFQVKDERHEARKTAIRKAKSELVIFDKNQLENRALEAEQGNQQTRNQLFDQAEISVDRALKVVSGNGADPSLPSPEIGR